MSLRTYVNDVRTFAADPRPEVQEKVAKIHAFMKGNPTGPSGQAEDKAA
jgi:hypothetical protein